MITIRAENGTEALKAYREEKPDFMCLDIVMPDKSGYDVCTEVRKEDPNIPIIFISTKSDPVEKVLGLELGADDYITKPFEIHEVVSRIRAVARRCLAQQEDAGGNTASQSFCMLDLEVLPKQLRAKRGENAIDLSIRDIKILQLLYDNKGNVIDRDMLLDYCWGENVMPESRNVDWYISNLRKKVELDPKDPKIIQTVHGAGYKFEQ
jgi:DNA-binding response OmpR family regulator